MTIKTDNNGCIQQTVIDDLTQSHSIRIADTMEAGFRDALEKLGWLPPEKVAETVRQAGEVMREHVGSILRYQGRCNLDLLRSLPAVTPNDLTEKSQHGLRYSTAPLKAALAEYDRTKPDRDALFEQIDSNEDVEAWEAEELAALRKVQEAFYEVTRDRNSRETCMCVGLGFMRSLAEKYP